ncbi:hypothetical protein [Parvularcula oceani]|uniref:hypothetical protein n=1 Tax=Parvularcula oceani TaxID=1247963 RepID=UPI0004E0D66A|nr:hypothetical protein [Parvularcula oceani]
MDRLLVELLASVTDSAWYRWLVLNNLMIVAVFLALFVLDVWRSDAAGIAFLAALGANTGIGVWKLFEAWSRRGEN